MTQKTSSSSKTEPRPTLFALRWKCSERCFQIASSPYEAISDGPRGRQTWRRVIFFLWGHLKAEVFKCRPQTLDELKDIIREKIANMSTETTIKVMESFRKRHLTDFIFKNM